ncbi:MAG: hypothetical protein KAX26_00775 [Anaerolineae bacterium]|nr:hypothetical protein [Anaerolineae bacterium]
MKKHTILSLMVVFMLTLTTVMSGCGGDAAPTTAEPEEAQGEEMEETVPDSEDILTDILSDDYEDALSARNQLALGTLKLEGSGNAVTPEQAQELALYWQALKALAADSTSATEETTAVQAQIVEAMTQVQLEAIAAMQLTSADLNEFYVEQGVELTTPEPGVTPQGGKNSGLSTEEKEAARATAEALGTPVGAGGGGGAERKDILLDTLIELLGQRAAE